MIDLHCHMLPGLDDGAPDLEMALKMARMAVADGITYVALTPHISPGAYDNSGPDIVSRVDAFRARLQTEDIALSVWPGADVHIDPQLPRKLKSGEVLALGDSHYFLLEPPHHVVPPRIDQLVKAVLAASYTPIITHPERLTWIESHYELIERLIGLGAMIQLTAGSVTGHFGSRPKYWSEFLLERGLVDLIATDAHNVTGRPPILSKARDAIAKRWGDELAHQVTYERPARILRNEPIPAHKSAKEPQFAVKARSASLLKRTVDSLRKWK